MSTSTIIAIVVSLISTLLCAGLAFFFFVLILGIILLRRRKKKVTARAAVKEGVQTVSMVFRKNQDGELSAVTDDGQDDEEK